MTAPPGVLTVEDFVSEVRAYIRDWKELNRIITGEESSDRMIAYAILLALDEYNTTPPLLSPVSIANFPSRVILLQLTLIHLLTSVGILKSRNRLSYSDGGWSVDTESQADEYPKWIQLLRSQVDARLVAVKISRNIEAAWGLGVPSEYAWLHGWYGATQGATL